MFSFTVHEKVPGFFQDSFVGTRVIVKHESKLSQFSILVRDLQLENINTKVQ